MFKTLKWEQKSKIWCGCCSYMVQYRSVQKQWQNRRCRQKPAYPANFFCFFSLYHTNLNHLRQTYHFLKKLTFVLLWTLLDFNIGNMSHIEKKLFIIVKNTGKKFGGSNSSVAIFFLKSCYTPLKQLPCQILEFYSYCKVL